MSDSSGSPRKNVNGATTMQTLISFGLEELKRSGSTDFNLETVLRESGVSRGSLYHHFGSRLGLITHCEAQLLKDTLKAENETIRALIESSASGVELFEVLALFIRTLGSPTLLQQRSRRIRTLATSVDDAELRATLAAQQVKGSQFLVDSFQIALDKGQIQPRMPLTALVYLMQSLFLGRILVDITEDDPLSDDWNEAVIDSLRHAINPQP